MKNAWLLWNCVIPILVLSSCAEVVRIGDAGMGGTGGAAGNSGTGGGGETGGSGGTGNTDACGTTAVCVPSVPTGWTGPVTVGVGPLEAPPCPEDYPAPALVANSELNAAPAVCSCGCVLANAQCQLFAETEDNIFIPAESCDVPPIEDDCLSAALIATCSPSPSENVAPLAWGTHASVCEGADPGDACSEGTCFPQPADSGPVCIFQNGDHSCPEEFPDRDVYFLDASDSRGCTTCGCAAGGGQCQVEIEVCSVGFFNFTLRSGQDSYCLNPSDGEGVSLLNQSITAQPGCTPSGGIATGEAEAISPVTVCCF